MDDYCTSEQLFLDVWAEYGYPDEIYDKQLINKFLDEIVQKSKTNIVLDHYSQLNFDCISKIEVKDRYTLIYWFDKNDLRERYLAKEVIDEIEQLEWLVFGYATYEYLLLDISKIKFICVKDHLFLLLLSNLITQREISKVILKNNDLIETEENTSNLYTRYSFFEGDPQNLIKHFCLVGNLPYYTCIIQPKENIPNTSVSTMIMLKATIIEVQKRLAKAQSHLSDTDEYDTDELFSIGNTIRRILEYTLKYYCVINEIDLAKLQIEQKYGHIALGDLRKIINEHGDFKLSQELINTANELSHDSGEVFSKECIAAFCIDSIDIVNKISGSISQ